ncbi:MAG: HAD hydrolase-like protein [Eubacteriales bacterium]|nr:HAD hydrolase-like protein [Eubacteriales bacterium]
MKYKYILFDLDGTLTDSKDGIINSMKFALEALGYDQLSDDEYLRFVGPPFRTSIVEYFGIGENEAKKIVEKYRERFSTIGLFENRVYEGIADMLGQLSRQGRILAVATSKPKIFSDRILIKYDLKKYFKITAGSEFDGTKDVKAEIIEQVLDQLIPEEKERTNVIMVGDRKYDIIGAINCGIDSIGVRYGYAEADELESAGATYIVNTVIELKEWLLNN